MSKEKNIQNSIKTDLFDDEEIKRMAQLKFNDSKISRFSFDSLMNLPADENKDITKICYLESDDDFFYLFPNPCQKAFFRIPKDSVKSVEPYSSVNCRDGKTKLLYIICFNVSSVILKTEVINPSDLEQEISKTSEYSALTLSVKIDFRANGEGTLKFNNKEYPCLGNNTIDYVKDVTVKTSDKFPEKYSNEFHVMMYYAILIGWKRGIFIHKGANTIATNGGEMSAGCVHLASPQIEEFYNWVNQDTRIQISYPW